MNKDEVEDWLDHIPVFAVTDSEGQGVVLRPDDDTSVFYFFMSPLMANATLSQLKESSSAEGMDLRVSAFSLGKIWFNILNSDEEKEVLVSISIYLVVKTDLSNDWLTFLNHSSSLQAAKTDHLPRTSNTDLFRTLGTFSEPGCCSP